MNTEVEILKAEKAQKQMCIDNLKEQLIRIAYQTRQDTLEEVESLLGIDMNEMSFVEISNHVDYGDWQALKSRYLQDQVNKITEGLKQES